MAVIDRGLETLNFLPDCVREALRRRLRELGGFGLIVLATLLALALATWSVQDPSLSHATNAPVRNLLGAPGAIVADLLMQVLGVAALAFILPIAMWGWRLITHRPLRPERLRLLFWVLGVVLSAGCAAALPRSPAWPLPVGLGGVIGDWVLRLPALLAGGTLAGAMRVAIAIIAGAGTLLCFAVVAGFGWRSNDRNADVAAEDDEASISLGWITHGFLSLKARLARALTRRPATPAPVHREAPPHGRIEPRFDASDAAQSKLAVEMEDEDDNTSRVASRKPRATPRAPRRSSGGYVLPSLELLATPKAVGRATLSTDTLQANATALEGVLADFGVRGEIINARPGPVVTLYELEPAPGIKSSRVIGLADDIARSMSALSARVAVVAGRNVIGIELSVYDGIPHLLTPVVTDPKKAVVALKWAVREMEERYKKMSKLGVRNIDGYNARVAEAKAKGEKLTRTVHTGYDKETGEAIYENEELDLEPLPFVVVIVDEMADLMMVAGKDIEGAVQRLAQMARAAGLHVILATQRPSVDVITGTIKANFPTRISFQVTSKIDSRTILGEQGAEQLLGQGDMLYMAGGGRISRVHGPFCSDEEVEKIVRHLKTQGTPQYLEAVTAHDESEEDEDGNVFDNSARGQT